MIHQMSTNLGIQIAIGQLETCLDVEWAHAIAPDAKILLVEATRLTRSDLLSAVDYAKSRPDVVAVSMSWGGAEDLWRTQL